MSEQIEHHIGYILNKIDIPTSVQDRPPTWQPATVSNLWASTVVFQVVDSVWKLSCIFQSAKYHEKACFLIDLPNKKMSKIGQKLVFSDN